MEVSNALRGQQQMQQPQQAPAPVQGVPDPFTQGGFGTGGFGMGQYVAPMRDDMSYDSGAMSEMGATSLGGGGTGAMSAHRRQAAAAAASEEQQRFNARRMQEVMDTSNPLVNRDLTAAEERDRRNAQFSESGNYTDPRVEESYGRSLTTQELRDKQRAQSSEMGNYTDPRTTAAQIAAAKIRSDRDGTMP